MIELLAPAGDFEKLKYAFAYGADAVYLAGKKFGMRAASGNFTMEELLQAVIYAHSLSKKIYVTINIFARNYDISQMEEYIQYLHDIEVDGVIVSDAGVINVIKRICPYMFVSLSTQASTTNYEAVAFWHDIGVNRVILARELSFDEIRYICEKKPKDMQIEMFVHGAMCISYSGRCLLSNYLTNRDANKGMCAQPCRWEYSLVEKSRADKKFDIVEDDRGTYIFNSKDLSLISKIDELKASGVDSIKIEGRMKSIFYISTIVKAYRTAIDKGYTENLENEVKKVSHRHYTLGFYDGHTDETSQNYETSSYVRNYDFIFQAEGYDEEKNLSVGYQRNKFYLGDKIEVLSPYNENIELIVKHIYDIDLNPMESTPHANQKLYLDLEYKLTEFDLLRKEIKEK